MTRRTMIAAVALALGAALVITSHRRAAAPESATSQAESVRGADEGPGCRISSRLVHEGFAELRAGGAGRARSAAHKAAFLCRDGGAALLLDAIGRTEEAAR